MKGTILYFDDDKENIECMALGLEHFNVVGSASPSKYSELLTTHWPHAIMIDVNMPELNGFELYKNIIAHPAYNQCPIFFISGDVSDENKIKSFQKGAIDFLARDLSLDELHLRLKNRIKTFLVGTKLLAIGNLKLDFEGFKASIEGAGIDLTLSEFRILSTLFRSSPHAVNRDEMTKQIWGDGPIKQATIHTHLANLRNKIAKWDYVIKVRDNNITISKIES